MNVALCTTARKMQHVSVGADTYSRLQTKQSFKRFVSQVIDYVPLEEITAVSVMTVCLPSALQTRRDTCRLR